MLSPNSTGPDRPLPNPDAVLGHSPMLVEDSRGDGTPLVRRLDPSEVWQVSGGTLRECKEGTREGVSPLTLLTGAARSIPPGTAHQILRAAAVAKGLGEAEQGRAATLMRSSWPQPTQSGLARGRQTRRTPGRSTSAG